MSEKLLTLREVARITGLSLSTIRRKVLQGELKATSFAGPHGDRWMVQKSDLDSVSLTEPVHEQGLDRSTESDDGEETVQDCFRAVEAVHDREQSALNRSSEARERENTVQDCFGAVEAVQGKEQSSLNRFTAAWQRENTVQDCFEVVEAVRMDSVPLDVHKMALETAHRALTELEMSRGAADHFRRRFEALEGELRTYQRALSEQAESLAERDARVKQQAALAEENLAKIAEFESQKQAMQLEISSFRDRVNWLEKRVPRWVRRVFGA